MGSITLPAFLKTAERMDSVESLPKESLLERMSHTREAIQAGISFAAEGLLRAALERSKGRVIGTGGDAPMFRDLFDLLVPDLALKGVVRSYLCWRR